MNVGFMGSVDVKVEASPSILESNDGLSTATARQLPLLSCGETSISIGMNQDVISDVAEAFSSVLHMDKAQSK